MPELPEVETIARTLEPLIKNAVVTQWNLLLPRTKDKGSLELNHLQGRRIVGVGRRAKLALIKLETEDDDLDKAHMLAVHLKMTGRLFVYDCNEKPTKHTRFTLALEHEGKSKQLFFDDSRTFGYVRLVSPKSLETWPFWQKLGLEPLMHEASVLAKQLEGKRAGIKGLLLNQEYIVGIGNIYADEALFQAKILPTRKADTITFAKLVELCSAVQDILRLSIEQCGSSIRDYRTARGDAGSFQNTFFVYGRGGQVCKVCGNTLQNARVAGRGTVLCPTCQS